MRGVELLRLIATVYAYKPEYKIRRSSDEDIARLEIVIRDLEARKDRERNRYILKTIGWCCASVLLIASFFITAIGLIR